MCEPRNPRHVGNRPRESVRQVIVNSAESKKRSKFITFKEETIRYHYLLALSKIDVLFSSFFTVFVVAQTI